MIAIFNLRLQALRVDRDLTQDQLADVLNITRSTISNYENGTREPDIKTLVKLADYFNVSLDYLLGRIDNSTPFFSRRK